MWSCGALLEGGADPSRIFLDRKILRPCYVGSQKRAPIFLETAIEFFQRSTLISTPKLLERSPIYYIPICSIPYHVQALPYMIQYMHSMALYPL